MSLRHETVRRFGQKILTIDFRSVGATKTQNDVAGAPEQVVDQLLPSGSTQSGHDGSQTLLSRMANGVFERSCRAEHGREGLPSVKGMEEKRSHR